MTEPAPIQALSPLFPADLSTIDASNRLRPVDQARVEALAASFSEIGQQAPIVVRPMTDGSNGVRLVAGAHRVAAAKLLGWTEIAAIWLDLDEAEARLVEIDENLIRNELCEIDRALSLAERKRLYEALHPETAHGKARKPKTEKGKVANLATFARFSKDAARSTGMSERTVQRACELAGSLSPEAIAAIRGTKIADNQAQLQALAALPPAEQVVVAGLIGAKAAGNVAKARVIAGHVPAGGAVREEDRPLAKLEPVIARLSLAQLQGLASMVASRIAALTPPARPARAKKGGEA
jgi:ParB family chromosome partitioning protein